MRLKSFHAATMADAMRQVRDVLGDDAIIVATREEEGGGVRVTAAMDEDDAHFGQPAPAPQGLRFAGGKPVEPQGPDLIDQLTDVLIRHGVPAALNQQILDAAGEVDTRDPITALAGGLDQVFTFQPLPDGRYPRALMLVGPPGSGKTLSIAKLCTRAFRGGRAVGVISTDTVRAGAIEQLSAYTRLLKLRLITAEDPVALADALEVQKGAEQVLVDSTGRNPYDSAEMKELRDFLGAADIEPVLVLPAGIDAGEAAEVAKAFRQIGVRRLLPTRMDMARRYGSLLTAAFEAELSFADASATSKVVDGLAPLTPSILARLLMPEADAAQRRAKQTGTHA
ncbi:MAG: hypothetical protein RLY86_1184 [Pseudomonadota bacterium]|jgi:flagellar biosynthesis protein FlhF